MRPLSIFLSLLVGIPLVVVVVELVATFFVAAFQAYPVVTSVASVVVFAAALTWVVETM